MTPDKLSTLTHASRILDELLNRAPNRRAPYVGESAFAHKGGIHVSAVQKDPRTYEHVPPEAVGNRRRLLVSDQGGRSNILAELDRIGIAVPKNDPRVARLLDEVKEREANGYAYEAADASFELLARRMLGNVPQFFDVESFRVMVERRHNAVGDLVTVSEATVKVRIDGETMLSVGEGNGPVNALDTALRKDLGRYQSYISDLELVDYKVRILTGGTDAVTRVLIESRDGEGNRWFTVGVSPNIVDASFEALLDLDQLQADPRRRDRALTGHSELRGDLGFGLGFRGLVAGNKRAGDGGNDRVHPVDHFEVKLEPGADEAFLPHAREQRQQRVPEAVDIGKHDRLLMLLELRPGELLDELLQCAETARQRHEGVRLHEHQMLPLMHVVDHNQFVSFEQHVLTRAQESGDDAA